MNVLLVANYANDRQVSMQRFASMLETGLGNLGCHVRTVRPAPVLAGKRDTGGGLPKWLGYIDKFVLFPSQLRRHAKWAQIVHICDHSNAAYTACLGDRPHVVTCHDLLAVRSALGEIPQNPTRWSGRLLQRMILNGLNHAMHVACPSEKSRKDLLRLTRHTQQTCSTVHNGLNYDYHRQDTAEALRQLSMADVRATPPFILHVGGDHWYKNREAVVRAFHSLRTSGRDDLKLVMVGPPLSAGQRRLVAGCGFDSSVEILSQCRNDTLRALYSLAELLLFPSLEEGFGWPVIEAQACGCRVVTSNRAPLTEIGGEGAAYADPENPDDLAAAALALLGESSSERQARIERGLRNAATFSAEKMIGEYAALYRVLRSREPAGTRLASQNGTRNVAARDLP